jgi:hypothetical protein
MKTHKTTQPIKNVKEIGVFRRVSLIITSAITLACLATTGKAANVLQNPDFEIGTLAWWSIENEASFAPIQPGSNQGQLYYL